MSSKRKNAALIAFGNIYYSIARRALDLTVESVKSKKSIGLASPSMAHHPEVQHEIAEMVLALEAIEPQFEKVAEDWSNGVDYGHDWVIKIVAAKHNAVVGSWKVVGKVLDIVGGYGIFTAGPYERLFRDARLGRIHPANPALTHELIAKLTLGLNPDEMPRWG